MHEDKLQGPEAAGPGAAGSDQDPTPAENATQPAAEKPASRKASRGRRTDVEYIPLWNNFITISGVFLVVIGLILLVTFGLFTVVSPAANPYVDIVGYLMLPGILFAGLAIAPIGIFFKRWRLLRRDPRRHLGIRFPRIDLNDPTQRRVVKFFLWITFLMLPVVGVSAYHGYHYTDSVSFCAQACHAVMAPEATAYAISPHARVSCAECHIGSGASWFVKSKLSGTRQVFATLWNSYPRPIPPAISNLRPARETCERCHWPEKFYGAQLAEVVRYSSDEQNTRREIDMLIKIGGGDETLGRAEGIHMHMALAGQIEYVATDHNLQVIPWVKWRDKTGREFIYRSDGRPSSDPPPKGQLRQFDCMDCHNRPAHNFRAPQESVDLFLEIGRIASDLPDIKREAVGVLAEPYPDRETAHARIGEGIMAFYRDKHPETWTTRLAAIKQAVDAVRQIYDNNFFPSMKVDWRTYPDNIGHKYSAGCFRCHEGKHVNQDGAPISHDCKICHTFLNPVDKNGVVQEGDFVHPHVLEGLHANLQCHQCHTGGSSLATTCQGCHDRQQGLYTATLPELSRFGVAADPMAAMVDCEGCHEIEERVTLQAVDAMCLDCHEDEEEEYEGLLARWSEEVGGQRSSAESAIEELMAWIEAHHQEGVVDQEATDWVSGNQPLLGLLAEAGPLHNHAAASRVYETLASEARAHLQRLEQARVLKATAAKDEG